MELTFNRYVSGLLVALGLIFICTVGYLSAVGYKPADRTKEFIPSPAKAESAIEAVMDAWKNGDPVGIVEGTSSPVVHVIDSYRNAGQVLEEYEILGEVPGNAPRCFAVKATLSHPDKQIRLRYVVVGIDPLWVFRHEDYDLLSHWEHRMEPTDSVESSEK